MVSRSGKQWRKQEAREPKIIEASRNKMFISHQNPLSKDKHGGVRGSSWGGGAQLAELKTPGISKFAPAAFRMRVCSVVGGWDQ